MKSKSNRKHRIHDDPAKTSKWYLARRRLPIWLEKVEGSESFYLPWMIVVMDIESGMILNAEMASTDPSAAVVSDMLLNLMRRLSEETGLQSFRPKEIQVEQKELEELRSLLEPYGVKIIHRPAPGFVNPFMQDFSKRMKTDSYDPIQDLVKESKVSPVLVANFFAAAAGFYRAEPWIWLSNEDVLKIQIGSQKDSRCVVIMGQGGESYGLSVFKDWEEVLDFFRAEDPMDTIPRKGRHVLFFEGPPDIPAVDYLNAKDFNWELVSEDAFPVPYLFRTRGVKRPDADMLEWYEAVMRAIPVFVRDFLQTNPEGSHPTVEAVIDVETMQGKKQVTITYPAGDPNQLLAESPVADRDFEDIGEGEGDLPPGLHFDRRSMEKDLSGVFGNIEDVVHIWRSDVYQAQDIMYDAWEEPDRDRRIELAKKALQVSPDCADAYVLLADEDASTYQKALKLNQAGVEAGKRALGEAFFQDEDNIGKFWGILETRPYMRALAGLASCFWSLDRLDETEKIYRQMLALNHIDNQGVRFQLLSLLFDRGRFEDASRLMLEYQRNSSMDWAYCRILLDFRANGPTAKLRDDLFNALEINPYVPEYLTGRKRIPGKDIDRYVVGSRDEAISYVQKYLNHWRRTNGATAWLKSVYEEYSDREV